MIFIKTLFVNETDIAKINGNVVGKCIDADPELLYFLRIQVRRQITDKAFLPIFAWNRYAKSHIVAVLFLPTSDRHQCHLPDVGGTGNLDLESDAKQFGL